MYCRNCGKPIAENDEYCADCSNKARLTNKNIDATSTISFVLGIVCVALTTLSLLCGIVGVFALSKEILTSFSILYIVSIVAGVVSTTLGVVSLVRFYKRKKIGSLLSGTPVVPFSIIGICLSFQTIVSAIFSFVYTFI
ncbi:MAG: hypothetical protein IKC64_06130 [Clostridia bacterium]|nr:hypothetical protein [Clostridia bacterium]